jgi:RNA polymerase sigma factor (sigma-70 family)
LFDSDKDLVSRCLKKDRVAEQQLYRRYAPKMYGVCLRYSGSEMDAEEILQNGFMNLFNRLYQYRFECPLDGWVRPIFVHAAINFFKKQMKFSQHVDLENIGRDATFHEDALSIISTKELLAMIQRLPVGYRTVFNMNVIEGYGHREIAEMLGISEGTSKSQLHHARMSMRRMLGDIEKLTPNGL